MPSAVGRGLAKIFSINLDYRQQNAEPVTRGESTFSTMSADSYVEEEPTVGEWLSETLPNGRDVVGYFASLFPIFKWLPFYNGTWFLGDLVAGVTIGAVVVPQSMAYAQLASLAPQFGLYSAFMGVCIYPFVGTSKDITIGVSLSLGHDGEGLFTDPNSLLPSCLLSLLKS